MTPEPGEIALTDMEATRALARDAIARVGPGSLLILTGPLGSGKTTFTSLLAQELGASAPVTSPTYTLVHEYPTPQGVLVHVDAYRLPDAAALEGLGIDAYLERARLVVVEWGEGLLAERPEALWLAFSLATTPGDEDPTRPQPTHAPQPSQTAPGAVVRTARWMRGGAARSEGGT